MTSWLCSVCWVARHRERCGGGAALQLNVWDLDRHASTRWNIHAQIQVPTTSLPSRCIRFIAGASVLGRRSAAWAPAKQKSPASVTDPASCHTGTESAGVGERRAQREREKKRVIWRRKWIKREISRGVHWGLLRSFFLLELSNMVITVTHCVSCGRWVSTTVMIKVLGKSCGERERWRDNGV